MIPMFITMEFPCQEKNAGNITLQYDNNGNMTQRAASGGDTLAITYNYDNMPTGIAKNGSSYIAYTYDGSGQRIRKQNLFTGNTVLYFGEVYEVRNNVGVIHLFAGNTRVASIRSDGYEQYYHSDHLGSASVITDASGNQQQAIQYFPFGAYRQNTTNPNFPTVNYAFTDQEIDDDTGLYNYKARLYDPVLGRFLSADSMIPDPGNLQSYNRYSYCQNNPLIYTDPSGHGPFSWASDAWHDISGAVSGIGHEISKIWHGVERSTIGRMVLTIAIGVGLAWCGGEIIAGIEAASYDTVFAGMAVENIAYAPAFTVSTATSASVYAGAGAVAGAAGAGISGNNVAMGALTGGLSGGAFGGLDAYYGGDWNLTRVGAYAATGAAVSAISGRGFEIGAMVAGGAAFLAYGYNQIVGYDADWGPGGPAQEKGALTWPYKGVNNIGTQGGPVDSNGWLNEGGIISRAANYIPGVNAVAGMHDTFQVATQYGFGAAMRDALNVPLMLPAAALSYGALAANPTVLTSYSIQRSR